MCFVIFDKMKVLLVDFMIIASIILSCISRQHDVSSSHFSVQNSTSIRKVHLLCEKFETDSRSIVLSWPSVMESLPDALYLLQARNLSDTDGRWKYISMMNETSIEVPNLPLYSSFRFLVTPIRSAGVSLPPLTSDLIMIKDPALTLSAPSNIVASNFELEKGSLRAVIRWNASKELPCSYKVIWLQAGEVDFASKTVVLPQDGLSVVLHSLLFGVNYTVFITPYEKMLSGISKKSWFMTPTCLTMTGHNFNLCAPSQPLNASVTVSPRNIVLSWLPPNNTSPQNPITDYYVLALDNAMKRIDFKVVGRDVLNISFSRENHSDIYCFEVRAVSRAGTGSPAFVQVPTQSDPTAKAINELQHLSSYSLLSMPIFYIPLCSVLIVLLASFVIWKKGFKKKNKLAGYPSGTAYVDSSMIPLLVPANKIKLTTVLGKGAFGIVQKGIYTRSKGEEEVAVKVLPAESSTRKQLLQEVEIMHLVGRHEKIVGLLGFTMDVEKMFLILEYCPMGDLHSYLSRLKPQIVRHYSLPTPPLPEYIRVTKQRLALGKRLCCYVKQVAEAMEYISSLKLIHRDLAARNIMMMDRDRVKIGDFGLSRDVYETRFYISTAQRNFLPLKWMAPEVLERQKFTSASDVWAFGVFMWEVFQFGKVPYTRLLNSHLLQFFKDGYRLEAPYCPKQWYGLMLECWRYSPMERPQFREIVKRVGEIIDNLYQYVVIV